MTFRPDRLDQFHQVFSATRDHIRAVPGCRHLELWEDARYPNVLTTYSHWIDAEALHAYRESVLFRSTWEKTKPLFAAAPVARSHFMVARID